MIKGNLVLGIGMIILSIALLLNYTVSLSHTVTVICLVIAIVFEIVGAIMMNKENRKK